MVFAQQSRHGVNMIYKKKNYSWVNEKTIDGVRTIIYRCDLEPSKCIKVVNGKVKKNIENIEMRKEWRKLNG